MNLWNDKRYYSLDYYLKEQFHDKIYKLSLNAGLTCPNRDGTIGTGGCIFCSEGGSGDFASNPQLSIANQIAEAKVLLKRKVTSNHFIAYFQAYTNTYGPIDYLRNIFMEAINHPDIIAISIATRPDCLPGEVLALLAQLNQIKPVYVELGLQTIHETTATLIHRGYPLSVFDTAVQELYKRNILVVVHIILGLPGEAKEDILATIDYLNHTPIQGVKLQLMHVLKHTRLKILYDKQPNLFSMMSFDAYIDTVVCCIESLKDSIVIHRLTGDGPKQLLIAPTWSANKRLVLNSIHKELKLRDTFQGKYIRNISE